MAYPLAYQDLVAGHVDLMCAEASATLPLLRDGKIKAYGVMAKARWFAAPNVPTMDEVGVPGLYIPWWQGLWAPKRTPEAVRAFHKTEIEKWWPIIKAANIKVE